MKRPDAQKLIEEAKSYILLNLFTSSRPISNEYAEQVLSVFQDISDQSLEELKNVHFLLSDQVCRLRNCFRNLMFGLEKTSERQIQEGSIIRGHIDWGRTVKLQAASMGLPVYAYRLPIRQYNTPYNQVIKYVLIQLEHISKKYMSNSLDNNVNNETTGYKITALNRQVRQVLGTTFLNDVSVLQYLPKDYLNSAKEISTPGYRECVDVYNLFKELYLEKNVSSLRELITEKLLTQDNKDKLFEMAMLFKIMEVLDGYIVKYNGQRTLEVLGRDFGQIAEYRIKDTTIGIRFQSQDSKIVEASKYKNYLKELGFERIKTRMPDVILRFTYKTGSERKILVEAKYTDNKEYIVDSIYKVFGYIYDFNNALVEDGVKAILVVGGNLAESSIEEDNELWVTEYYSINEVFNKLLNIYVQ